MLLHTIDLLSNSPRTNAITCIICCRENFVQVDVFYKSLRYEEISIHQAFPFLSLLSEVGGFMGLLLGASTLTVIEILDYTIMFGFKKAKQKVLIKPANTLQINSVEK